MDVLYPRCAGLDVHKDSVPVCVASRRRRTVKPAVLPRRGAGCSHSPRAEFAWLHACRHGSDG